NQTNLNKVFITRPWSIDGYLNVLHHYWESCIYQDFDWETQDFWIELKGLLPELMKVKIVEDMGRIMGEVRVIDPKDAIPAPGKTVKVCVKINLLTPLRRGILAVNSAGNTKWIRFYYEKQPHKICPKCFVLKHSNKACDAAAKFLELAHQKPHFFGNTKS
ncbi:hypothetical protein MKW92_018085, partial [Papaver armeniacum]